MPNTNIMHMYGVVKMCAQSRITPCSPYHTMHLNFKNICHVQYSPDGCVYYPTYLNPNNNVCVEKCPSGTVGFVTGSVDDVSSDRLRACVQSKSTLY